MAAWASLAVAPARRIVGENDFEKNAMVCSVPFSPCCASHPLSATPEASHESKSGRLGSKVCSRRCHDILVPSWCAIGYGLSVL
jgi:hypothetical protein